LSIATPMDRHLRRLNPWRPLCLRYPGPWTPGPACRRCGCTELQACRGGCAWTTPFLYTACASAEVVPDLFASRAEIAAALAVVACDLRPVGLTVHPAGIFLLGEALRRLLRWHPRLDQQQRHHAETILRQIDQAIGPLPDSGAEATPAPAFTEAFRALYQRPPVRIELSRLNLYFAIGLWQLCFREPEVGPRLQRDAEDLVRHIQRQVFPGGLVAALLELGWRPESDVPETEVRA